MFKDPTAKKRPYVFRETIEWLIKTVDCYCFWQRRFIENAKGENGKFVLAKQATRYQSEIIIDSIKACLKEKIYFQYTV